MNQITEEIFLEDMKDHTLRIIQDDGVYRHIRMSNGGSQCMCYYITTWPGHLCISGDMGTYVFARTQDMFKFFRPTILNPKIIKHRPLKINAPYWGEKLAASSTTNGFMKFSEEVFELQIKSYFADWEFESEDLKSECWDCIETEVLAAASTEEQAMYAADSFSFNDFKFTDFWELTLKDYTYHYLWCLYAIVYGIQQYDTEKSLKPSTA